MLTENGQLVLIDFDECTSVDSELPKLNMKNPDYIINPTEEDYLCGYDDETPEFIEDQSKTLDEEGFYLSKNLHDESFEKSIEKLKNMF